MPPTAAPMHYMQGIAVPGSSVRPEEFFQRTRRKRGTEVARPFAGLGNQDVVTIRKTGVVAGLIVRLDGSVTVTPGGGSVASTARWPYDVIDNLRFTANGQSNLINVSGAKLKARAFMAKGDLSDRGIAQTVNGLTVNQGTLAGSNESWGVGSRTSAIAAGTYDLDLNWFVPIAEDQVDLHGAIFAATSSTDLSLTIDWAPVAKLFTLAGGATVSVAGTLQVAAVRYDIPLGADGEIVVPDLSMFHSLIQTRSTALATGVNEVPLIGQGAGKTLLRTFSQIWNGATPAPIQVNEDNFGRMAWRYSGNETPDEYQDAQLLRIFNEMDYNCDLGAIHGFFAHEFAAENAFRDAVDLGTTAEWRQVVELLGAVVPNNLSIEVVQETVFQAGQGA